MIFDKITNLSNTILDSFHDNFLSDEFCSKVTFIYENQLSKLDIKVLKSIHKEMNNTNNNSELKKLVLQHIPKNNDEKYFIDFFEQTFKEYFYRQGVSYQKNIFRI